MRRKARLPGFRDHLDGFVREEPARSPPGVVASTVSMTGGAFIAVRDILFKG
jgi:hypothetical protein